MKKVLMASALMLCTSAVFADPTAVLKVNGKLAASTCSVIMGNGGVIDYGYIRLNELNATENNDLGNKSIPMTIDCTAKTKVGFTMQDNRSSSKAKVPITINGHTDQSNDYYIYGVGKTAGDVKIGNYGLWLEDIKVDGAEADPIARNHNWSSTHQWMKSAVPRTDAFQTMSFAAAGTTTPIAFKTATFNFVTELGIKDTNTLNITDDTALDGQATMTLVYL